MKICFINNKTVNPNNGGTERVTDQLGNLFLNASLQVYHFSIDNICTNLDNPISKNKKIESVAHIASELKAFVKRHNIEVIINQSERILVINAVQLAMHDSNIKLIHCLHHEPDYLLKTIRDYKKYIYADSFSSKIFYKLIYHISFPIKYYIRLRHLQRYYKLIEGTFDKIVILSDSFKKKLALFLTHDGRKKINVIQNPILKNIERPLQKKQKEILFISSMITDCKRPDRILEIWKLSQDSLHDWKLKLLGDGRDLDLLKQMAIRLKLKNISFLGRVSPWPHYEKASIICMTSSSEGFGMVLIEAQKNNCFPIAFNSFNSVTDIIINNKNGIVVHPTKNKLFAEKLISYANNINFEKNNKIEINSQLKTNKEILGLWLEIFHSKL